MNRRDYRSFVSRVRRAGVEGNDTRSFVSRLRRLGIANANHRLMKEVQIQHLTGDQYLAADIKQRLDDLEAQLLESPFLEPDPASGLGNGDVEWVHTPRGQAARMSVEPGRPNHVTHVGIYGKVGSGKSVLQGVLASGVAAQGGCTLVLDTTRSFRKYRKMLETHNFVRFTDIVIGLWDLPKGVAGEVGDQYINHLFAETYPLIMGEYELNEITEKVRRTGTPNVLSVLHTAKETKRKLDKYSNRQRYIDTLMLIMGNLYRATGSVLRCARGMDLERLLVQNNVVVELNLLPEHQSFMLKFLYLFVYLKALSGAPVDRPLTVFIDEGQVLSQMKNFAETMLTLRHCGIHVVINFQNCCRVPVEISAACDAQLCFQTNDQRDRAAFQACANLTPEQADHLALLETGECVCFLPGTRWKVPFLGKVAEVQFCDVADEEIARQSQEFVKQFKWVPVEETGLPIGFGDRERSGKLDANGEAFLRDVLNQAHEFSPLTQRFERAGIRSGTMQGRVLKRLIGDGYIKVWELAIGRGHPIKLVGATGKALAEHGVEWRATGRGTLVTRAATQFMFQKLRRLDGWQVVREGTLDG